MKKISKLTFRKDGDMSSVMRKIKRGLKRHHRYNTVEYNTEILVHGRMVYGCERCDRRWSMYLEKGIEEPGDDHKPSPFVIQCPFCGGMARDISGIIGFAGGGYYPLPDGASYFANRKDSDCGVPILN